MIPRTKQDEFVTALKAHLDAFFPDGALKSYFLGRIVSTTHHNRLKDLLDRTQGQIVFGVKAKDQNGPEPTIVRDVKPGDSLLEEEIFDSIFPVVPVDDIFEAIEFVNARSHALFLYTFSEDESVKQHILDKTTVAALFSISRYGYQVLKATYDEFTHTRSSIDVLK